MNVLLLDTNAYSMAERGNTELNTLFETATGLAISSIALGELYAGFAMGTRERANRELLDEFIHGLNVTIVAVDEVTAAHYGEVRAFMRRAGRSAATNDLWIAATALQHRFDLCSFDADFRGIPGLRVGTSLSDFL